MRSFAFLLTVWFLVLGLSLGQEEHQQEEQQQHVPEAPNCDAVIQETRDQSWDAARRECEDRINANRQPLLEEIQQLRTSLEHARNEQQSLRSQVDEYRQAHEASRTEVQGLLDERVLLQDELAKVQNELASVTFVKQVQKELAAIWEAIVAYFSKLTAKKDAEL